MKEAGVDIDIVEDGKKHLKKNALIKAKSGDGSHRTKLTLADDSGLEIDALNGEPGSILPDILEKILLCEEKQCDP